MAASYPKKLLGELLVTEGLVSQKQVSDALRIQKIRGGKLAEILIASGYLHMGKFEKFIVSQPGIASVDLSQYKIMSDLCDLIPEEMARTQQLFPIDRMGKLLTVGMAVPLDVNTISKLTELTGLRVKAVYCKSEHIRGAIDRYYRKEEAAVLGEFQTILGLASGSSSMVRIATLLRSIDDLPSLPETVRKTKEVLDDPGIAMEEVEAFIGNDPLVSANVLKLANSAAYKFSGRIDNVGMAVRLLGLQETYNMVLASSVLSMAEGTKGFDFQRFWREALFTASAVPAVATEVNIRPSSALSTAGLLHDIGRFGLAQASATGYRKVDRKSWGKGLVGLEEELLGLGHPEAGYMIAQRWELPEEIATLIRFHHTPEKAESMENEACIVSLAAFLSEAHTNQDILNKDGCFEELQHPLEHLGVSAERISDIHHEIASNFSV